ncbi:MAG TPA: chemotaxis protein CheD [Blastocatellia bacterium]|nr:chemotaxis protein CheD [Blastocatellia bacterium]
MRQIVGVGDMKIGTSPDDQIVTYALGSCLGITIYDPVTRIGGMLHVMLPDSTIDAEKAAKNPYMFVDTGLPVLFHSAYRAGAKKENIILKVAGGACMGGREEEDRFQIGKRNFTKLRQLLWKNGVLLKAQNVGGSVSRTMTLDIATGEVTLRTNEVVTKL